MQEFVMALSRAIAQLNWKAKFQSVISQTEFVTPAKAKSQKTPELNNWLRVARNNAQLPLPNFQRRTKELTTFHRTVCKMANTVSTKTFAL